MRSEKHNIRVRYIDLNRDNATEAPFCRDYFHYKVISPFCVNLMYTLQLFDDFSELIGELKAECELSSNQQITSFHLDNFMGLISRDGRERFNALASRYHIKMFIPRADTLHVTGEAEDAA